MTDSEKPRKPPRRKHQPRGLTILHEDEDIIVVSKSSGLLTVSTEKVRENTAYFLLTDYVRKGNPKSRNRVFIVHRLDQHTSGVLVFARNAKAKRFLQDEWPGFKKRYVAVVRGRMPKREDTISSLLADDAAHKVRSVTDRKKGKLAVTAYRVVKETRSLSLLEIDLRTGRKHQIRVHLADAGHPVVGDGKYGVKEKGSNRIALHAAALTIVHPFTKKPMTFRAEIPAHIQALVGGTAPPEEGAAGD